MRFKWDKCKSYVNRVMHGENATEKKGSVEGKYQIDGCKRM